MANELLVREYRILIGYSRESLYIGVIEGST
jgi:hypothetical protein